MQDILYGVTGVIFYCRKVQEIEDIYIGQLA